MSLEFIGRLQKELSLTGNAVYESVVAVAERVNRKVHILRLHGQSAGLLTQVETVYGELGQQIVKAFPHGSPFSRTVTLSPQDLDRPLNEAMERIQHLKQTLIQVDAQIRELKLEAIHEDPLAVQRDLSLRAAALERLTVSRGAPAIGKTLSQLSFPPSVRLVTIFRGPFLLTPSDTLIVHQDDIVILIGLRTELDQAMSWFIPNHAAQSA